MIGVSMVVRKPGFRVDGRSYQVCFSPQGDRLATLAVHVDLWDVGERKRVARSHPFKHPSRFDFSPDGEKLAVKSTSGEIVILDAPSLEEIARHSGRAWGEEPKLCSPRAATSSSTPRELVVCWCATYLRGRLCGARTVASVVQHVACSSDRRRWAHSVWRYPLPLMTMLWSRRGLGRSRTNGSTSKETRVTLSQSAL